MLLFIFGLVALLVLSTYIFLQQDKFGKTPSGARLERIKHSPNYRDGQFQNLSHTPALTEGVSYWAVMKEFFFSDKKRKVPTDSLPSEKVDLLALEPDENVLIWFGHSSYFMQIDGKRILVDPVLSGAASPLSFTTRSFKGTDRYTADDIPAIDYLFISHDHWDHLDHTTVVQLKDRIGKVICALGTGAHLEHWGFKPEQLIEHDWNDSAELEPGFTVHTLPARHFSGRGFSRNKALWASFLLKTPSLRIYIGGDSGYDTHFAEIGQRFGPIDWAILENGQYDPSWKYIHMMPEEVVQAAKDLKAKRSFPVHSSKFSLGNHPWDEPLIRVTKEAAIHGVPMITPRIGEKLNLGDSVYTFAPWWEGVN